MKAAAARPSGPHLLQNPAVEESGLREASAAKQLNWKDSGLSPLKIHKGGLKNISFLFIS